MIYYYIAMSGVGLYFISCFFRYSRTVTEDDKGGKVVINKLEIFKRPNIVHGIIFIIITFLIYWLYT